MRFFLAFAVLAASLSNVSALRGQDNLFSEVAMESVFEKSVAAAKSVASQSSGEKIDRITGTSTLLRALKAAGFEPQQTDGRATFTLEHAGWAFPASLGVEIEQDRVICDLSLVEIGKDTAIDHQVLLSLLAAGNATEGAFFAYDKDENVIQLRASLSNRAVTASQLRADLQRLARVAESHADLWSKLEAVKKKTEKVVPESPRNSELPQDSFSLVGRWAASLSTTDAFAIQIESKGRFQLVHFKSGKSTISKGKATRTGTQLTLAGDDGTKLRCTVTWTNAEQFQLAINDAKGNAKVKLDFKKQK